MEIFVIKTEEVERTLKFFTQLGLTFVQEQHNNGPIHYACEQNRVVFEIYPKGKTEGFKFID